MTGRADLVRIVRATTYRIGSDFTDPDDDWVPVLFALGKELRIFAIPGQYANDPDAKDALFGRVLPDLVRTENVKAIAIVVSAWMVEGDAAAEYVADEKRRSLVDHPKRVERLVLSAVDRVGEEMWWAPIERDGVAPPKLGKWEQAEGLTSLGGRIPEMFRSILRGAS